eukprot:6610445-Alexandrium_andersonii.AAC.1
MLAADVEILCRALNCSAAALPMSCVARWPTIMHVTAQKTTSTSPFCAAASHAASVSYTHLTLPTICSV